jgi:hypothetical protein
MKTVLALVSATGTSFASFILGGPVDFASFMTIVFYPRSIYVSCLLWPDEFQVGTV